MTSKMAAGSEAPGWATKPHRIDVHHHVRPFGDDPEERARFLRSAPDYAFSLDWSPAKALDTMDRFGIEVAVISSPSSGRTEEPEAVVKRARQTNDFEAKMVEDFPGRFGMFAALPMPHIGAALEEIEYAFDVLKADGVCLPTNFGDTWPGDELYAPVFEELNRRKAIVFFHPTAPIACEHMLPGIPVHFIEYPTDTTRAATSLLYSGTLMRCPDIRFILSHGGGTVPMLAHRIARLAAARPSLLEKVPDGVVETLAKLYFDTVTVTNPPGFAARRTLTEVSHILFGTDNPTVGPEYTLAGFAEVSLSVPERRAIERDNALALLPRVRRFAEAASRPGGHA